ncbi:MAG: NYN domain-containing protein [Planctomycetota bacterium]
MAKDTVQEESNIALYIDFDNIALGLKEAKLKHFEIERVIERLADKGKIVVKKAYADWEYYGSYKRPLHEAGIEMIYIPQKHYSGKNSADIRLVVDAMDLCYSKEHIDLFVVASGDSDFSPLVSKLKENAKYTIGLGVKNSSSKLLIDNCDEFIFYEDLVRPKRKALPQQLSTLPKKKVEAFNLLVDSLYALMRENKDVIWGSMIKQNIKRKHPQFDEGYFGYHSFSQLLEDAERHKIFTMKKDERSGGYIITKLNASA